MSTVRIPEMTERVADELRGQADTEYNSRIEADRCTEELKHASTRRVDAGKRPITESPLFGGPAQEKLFP